MPLGSGSLGGGNIASSNDEEIYAPQPGEVARVDTILVTNTGSLVILLRLGVALTGTASPIPQASWFVFDRPIEPGDTLSIAGVSLGGDEALFANGQNLNIFAFGEVERISGAA